VVTDGGRAVVGGAAKAWPYAELRRCEYHLARNLLDVLPQRVRDNQQDELHLAARRAQHSVQDWDAYESLLHARAAQETGFAAALARTGRLDALIRTQVATRNPVGPHSTGPLERYFRGLELAIGDRAAKMTNKHRADALLHLLTARYNGWVDEDAWTELIRDHLVARKGHATHQRLRTDPAGSPSLR
jgi:transposase-like protein